MKKLSFLIVVGLVFLLYYVSPTEAVTPCARTVNLRHGYAVNNYGYNNYGYNNYNYVQEVNPVVVVGVPVANLGLPYYWSVGEELREDRVAAKAAALVKSEKPAKQEKSSPVRQPEAGVNLDFDLIGGEAAAQSKPVQNSSALDNQVLAIFKESCISCHKPGKAIRGILLLSQDGELHKDANPQTETKRRWKIYDSVFGGEGVSQMPKGGSLPDDKVETIRLWTRETMN